jgi:hypothetical protein
MSLISQTKYNELLESMQWMLSGAAEGDQPTVATDRVIQLILKCMNEHEKKTMLTLSADDVRIEAVNALIIKIKTAVISNIHQTNTIYTIKSPPKLYQNVIIEAVKHLREYGFVVTVEGMATDTVNIIVGWV